MYENFFKRLIDFSIALISLLLLLPILIFVTITLLIVNKRAGAFFVQDRPGRFAKVFKIIKFRTMTDERDGNGNLLPDSKRITKIGRFIRSTSIDELPQLINVIKGDMALVGPRPLLVRYLDLYSGEQARRHEVRPGLTGWAQCNGRNAINWDEKFKLDIWYVDHISLSTDFRIILLTIKRVLQRRDINSRNSVTMELFAGCNRSKGEK